MPFLDHLEELRWRILWSLLAVIACSIAGFVLVDRLGVMMLLIHPIEPFLHGEKLKYLSPTDPFFVTLKLAITTGLVLAFGIVFELPVVILILSAMGLVTPEFLASKRRHAIAGITVVASVLTPGDVITVTLMMMVPLTLLYELSIVLSRLVARRRLAHAAAGA
jgi:sec-independent protein translocase protein TatC